MKTLEQRCRDLVDSEVRWMLAHDGAVNVARVVDIVLAEARAAGVTEFISPLSGPFFPVKWIPSPGGLLPPGDGIHGTDEICGELSEGV